MSETTQLVPARAQTPSMKGELMKGSQAQHCPRPTSQSPGPSLVLFSSWWRGGGSPNSCPHLGPEWPGAPGVCSELGRHRCGQAGHPSASSAPSRGPAPQAGSSGLVRVSLWEEHGGEGRKEEWLPVHTQPSQEEEGTGEPGTGKRDRGLSPAEATCWSLAHWAQAPKARPPGSCWGGRV